jgi:hypothetical protein
MLVRSLGLVSSPSSVAPASGASARHAVPPPFASAFRRRAIQAEIFVETSTHEMIDFRSVRDTGITLHCLAGERTEIIQREAGHEKPETTLATPKEVDNKRERFGNAYLTPEMTAPDPSLRPNGPVIGPNRS